MSAGAGQSRSAIAMSREAGSSTSRRDRVANQDRPLPSEEFIDQLYPFVEQNQKLELKRNAFKATSAQYDRREQKSDLQELYDKVKSETEIAERERQRGASRLRLSLTNFVDGRIDRHREALKKANERERDRDRDRDRERDRDRGQSIREQPPVARAPAAPVEKRRKLFRSDQIDEESDDDAPPPQSRRSSSPVVVAAAAPVVAVPASETAHQLQSIEPAIQQVKDEMQKLMTEQMSTLRQEIRQEIQKEFDDKLGAMKTEERLHFSSALHQIREEANTVLQTHITHLQSQIQECRLHLEKTGEAFQRQQVVTKDFWSVLENHRDLLVKHEQYFLGLQTILQEKAISDRSATPSLHYPA